MRCRSIPRWKDPIHRYPPRNLIGARHLRRHACRQQRELVGSRYRRPQTRQREVSVLTWIAPIIVFGLVVFVHELGHFVAAKLTGVYAPRFSIGFGPSLLKRRVRETGYVPAARPLGGGVGTVSWVEEGTTVLLGGRGKITTAPRGR